MAQQTTKRSGFGGKLAAILAAAGSAIGLGNIWRFPCETGANGGAAFILVYIFGIVFITVLVLIAELAAGRESRTNVYDAFRTLPEQLVPDCKYVFRNWPKGSWHESKITVRFWITTILLAAATMITLKIR